MSKSPVKSGFITKYLLATIVLTLFSPLSAFAQLNENCTISILNRTANVKPDGTWRIDNVPANFGQVRARATCIENGVTKSGQSDFFNIDSNTINGFNADIPLGVVAPVPESLTVSSSIPTLPSIGATAQLTVTANFPSGNTSDVTPGSTGTNYVSSNPATATVNADGLVTAVASGTVVVNAMNDGALGLIRIRVVLTGDSDGDGISDDLEISLGLDPNNPVDGLEDPDRDGLTNAEEANLGTDINNPDTDGDGISDGEEVVAGTDGFITDPQLADTDGDGVRDALEISTGSDPTNPTSFNLAQALTSIEVSPSSFVLTVNTIIGEVSRQLAVTGNLSDGTTIDLTSTALGTSYTSSDLNVCNFGLQAGRVFAGNDGSCTITVANNGFSHAAGVIVTTFAPTPLSFVSIPGYANNVDVNGDYAYVAAGSTGLQVVDVSNPGFPSIVGSVDTPGNANDIKVLGNLAYLADGSSGLQIVDITTPTNPVIIGSVDTPGEARDVFISNNLAFIADGLPGVQIIDVTSPTNPSILGTVDTPGNARAVDVSNSLLVVGDGAPASGVRIVDIADPTNPQLIGNVTIPGETKDLTVSGSLAYVAAFTGGFQIVDYSLPTNPQIVGSLPGSSPLGFVPRDAAVFGQFALAAEQLFPHAVPIVDIGNPANPIFRGTLDFSPLGDYAGTGIAVTQQFVYETAEAFIVRTEKNGTTGNTRLFIGQYLALEDNAGIPPTVNITSPNAGDNVIEGSTISIDVNATDDIAVAGVDLLVDGTTVATDTSAPFQFSFPVPVGATSLTFGATAVDLGSNVGVAPDVLVNVIPDPLTTVIGSVVDKDGLPVTGASVTTLGGLSGTTAGDGTFSIPGVPTILGNINVDATATVGGTTLRGTSASVTPVPGGITDVGDITVVLKITIIIDFNTGAGNPLSYFESGLTVISRYPFGAEHLHFGFGQPPGTLMNHGGCCSTPYEFTFGSAAFNVISLDVVQDFGGTRTFTSSSGAVETITGLGTHVFPVSGWQDITSFRWDETGQTSIDNLVIEAAPP